MSTEIYINRVQIIVFSVHNEGDATMSANEKLEKFVYMMS